MTQKFVDRSIPTNRTVLVSGASQGIGEAAAQALAADGYRVIALARNVEKLKILVGSLPHQDRNHGYLAADLHDLEKLRIDLSELVKNVGPIHALVCNSGGPKPGHVHSAEIAEFELALRQHLFAPQVLVQTLLPGMKAAGFGRIVNVISTSVKIPIPGLGVSNTVRGAVANWAKTLSLELGPFGITVNNVLPGFTKTGRLAEISKRQSSQTGRSATEIESEWLAQVPLRRFAEPSEVAAAISFLASDSASYVNGINLPVDGGRTGSL